MTQLANCLEDGAQGILELLHLLCEGVFDCPAAQPHAHARDTHDDLQKLLGAVPLDVRPVKPCDLLRGARWIMAAVRPCGNIARQGRTKRLAKQLNKLLPE